MLQYQIPIFITFIECLNEKWTGVERVDSSSDKKTSTRLKGEL